MSDSDVIHANSVIKDIEELEKKLDYLKKVSRVLTTEQLLQKQTELGTYMEQIVDKWSNQYQKYMLER